ncbi:MAG: YdcF family protein [Chloroflexi bacterium]|nr:YdcF family protein [Chloroflexota bacterium]
MRSRTRWLVLVLLVAALVALHPVWLGAIGDALLVHEPLQQSDAIVVLAGNSPYRSAHGFELYREGWAPIVMISDELIRSHEMEADWSELWRRGLVTVPAPASAVVLFGPAASTHEEAVLSREVMLAHGWQRAILVTDPFHMRRATAAFRHEWQPAGLEVVPSPADESPDNVDHWWLSPDKALHVGLEYAKFVYYVVRGYL